MTPARSALAMLLAGALLSAGASAAPGKGDEKEKPFGAAARAKYGPDPMAAPPADVGSAEDPAPIAEPALPPAAPPQPDKPAPRPK